MVEGTKRESKRGKSKVGKEKEASARGCWTEEGGGRREEEEEEDSLVHWEGRSSRGDGFYGTEG